jgi:DNA-binding transcriptional MerR regulator
MVMNKETVFMLNGEVKKRLTITEVAHIVGISTKTIIRWEKLGKIKKPKRDWRSWRVYEEDDLIQIRQLHEALFEV